MAGSAHLKSIQLSNGVFGGFVVDELQLASAILGAYLTILSGDLGVLGDNSDNVYHVIAFNSNFISPRLDGLIIQDGNANYTDPVNESGGAIYDESVNSHPVAANCVFRNNTASNYGGAVQVLLDTFDFIQCLFYNNSANRGGAVYIENGDPNTSDGSTTIARFYNCTAVNNSAGGFNTGGFCEALAVMVEQQYGHR